jgi:putative membrane protein
MKRLGLSIIAGMLIFSGFIAVSPAGAQTDNHTTREEAEGEIVWQKLQSKEVGCVDLSDEDFGALGEYYMGQMLGDSHEAMNEMMMRMHGEEGEEQIHVVMGKRLSGCDTSATVPGISGGWMPMMNFGFGSFGSFGWIFMILWWVLIITGIVALIKWLTSQSRGTHNHEKPASPAGKSALEILKERYAKGEIDRKEFEEKKKDLGV